MKKKEEESIHHALISPSTSLFLWLSLMFIHIILFLCISSICILRYNVILFHVILFIVLLQRTRQNSEFSMGTPANAIMQIF